MASHDHGTLPDARALPFMPIPESESTCSVKVLKAGSVDVPLRCFVETKSQGIVTAPAFAFLINHKASGINIVFDLGMKTDKQNYSPVSRSGPFFTLFRPSLPNKSIAQQLDDGGFDLKTIKSAVYSHVHLDHVGDVGDFPETVELVVGPGSTVEVGAGWPTDPESRYAESDLPKTGRSVRELDESLFNLQIGSFAAHDYFGDGSLYFLDSPGHVAGHILALVRVTSSPSSFVLLSGDATHHRVLYSCCIAHGDHPHVGHFSPPGLPISVTMHADLPKALQSMAKLSRMEMEDSVFVLPAHDHYFDEWLEEKEAWWNAQREVELSRWKELGLKEEIAKRVEKDAKSLGEAR